VTNWNIPIQVFRNSHTLQKKINNRDWKEIEQCIVRKLSSWKGKHLSVGGKLVLFLTKNSKGNPCCTETSIKRKGHKATTGSSTQNREKLSVQVDKSKKRILFFLTLFVSLKHNFIKEAKFPGKERRASSIKDEIIPLLPNL
jgi:hypothetical protein